MEKTIDAIIDNEMAKNITDAVKSRLGSPVYVNFIIFWIIFHWNIIFTLLFVSEDLIFIKTGMLKNEYLNKLFFSHDVVSIIFIILPFLLTYLSIWILPKKILTPGFEKVEESKTAHKIFLLQKEKQVETAKKDLTQENVDRLNLVAEKTRAEKAIVRNLGPEVAWEKDFDEFKKIFPSSVFKKLVDSIYANNNKYHRVKIEIPSDFLIHADANELVTILSDSDRITLTDKGRYFVKRGF